MKARLGRIGDERLGHLVAGGDEAAFEALYDRHHATLLAFCRHMLGSREDGEDALQQAFLRAHRALADGRVPDRVRPWLFAIARNRCLTVIAARRDAALPADDLEPSFDGLAHEVERRADLRELLADLGRLPDDQRGALVLAELGDFSHVEIGRVLGCPPAKVKALVFQARTTLVAERDARQTPCHEIRALLESARGGVLRRGPLRRHLRQCDPCATYRASVERSRTGLAILLPVAPTAGLKAAVLGGGAETAAAAAAAAAGGGGVAAAGTTAGGGVVAAVTTKALVAKVAVVLAVGAGGGAAVSEAVQESPQRAGRPGVAAPQRAAQPIGSAPPRLVQPVTATPQPVAAVAPRGEGAAAPGGVAPSGAPGAVDERIARAAPRARARLRRAILRRAILRRAILRRAILRRARDGLTRRARIRLIRVRRRAGAGPMLVTRERRRGGDPAAGDAEPPLTPRLRRRGGASPPASGDTPRTRRRGAEPPASGDTPRTRRRGAEPPASGDTPRTRRRGAEPPAGTVEQPAVETPRKRRRGGEPPAGTVEQPDAGAEAPADVEPPGAGAEPPAEAEQPDAGTPRVRRRRAQPPPDAAPPAATATPEPTVTAEPAPAP